MGELRDLELETSQLLRSLAIVAKQEIEKKFPHRTLGFACMAMDIGEGGMTLYSGTVEREGMIKLLRETADHLEAGGALERPPRVRPGS